MSQTSADASRKNRVEELRVQVMPRGQSETTQNQAEKERGNLTCKNLQESEAQEVNPTLVLVNMLANECLALHAGVLT